MYPFERFTDEAKRALTVAQAEAERSHHTYIGTEHLLLALFQVEGAMAARILADLRVEIGPVRAAIKDLLHEDERILAQQIIPTSRVKKVIEMAFEEGRRRGGDWVGTHYLLLGLLTEGKGIAAHILRDRGVTVERVDEAIRRLPADGVQETAADPRRLADGLDDLAAVELLISLLDRFGASTLPPPSLVQAIAELREGRRRTGEAEATAQLEAWRHRQDG